MVSESFEGNFELQASVVNGARLRRKTLTSCDYIKRKITTNANVRNFCFQFSISSLQRPIRSSRLLFDRPLRFLHGRVSIRRSGLGEKSKEKEKLAEETGK